MQRRVWRERGRAESDLNANLAVSSDINPNAGNVSGISTGWEMLPSGERDQSERNLVDVEEGRIATVGSELSAPLIQSAIGVQRNTQEGSSENFMLEGIGLGSSGAIKLGLGDFIFYSVLVGRAAMYDFMTVYACYLAIIAGLGITLMLLAFYQKALPALPVSVLMGVLFYLLTRLLLETFIVQCSINVLMF